MVDGDRHTRIWRAHTHTHTHTPTRVIHQTYLPMLRYIATNTAKSLVFGIPFFFLVERILIHLNVFEHDKKRRYFILHVVANAIVTCLCARDVYFVLTRPLMTNMMSPTNVYASYVAFSLHIYHILMFRPLDSIDWLHHGLSVFVAAPLTFGINTGPLHNFGMFFVTGLPGGIDYAMLILVKKGRVLLSTQKRLSAWLHIYVRCPGMIIYAGLLWVSWIIIRNTETLRMQYADKIKNDLAYIDIIVTVCCVIYYWNGTYFMHRVVYNYGYYSNKRIRGD